jgi:hypothetical protein
MARQSWCPSRVRVSFLNCLRPGFISTREHDSFVSAEQTVGREDGAPNMIVIP